MSTLANAKVSFCCNFNTMLQSLNLELYCVGVQERFLYELDTLKRHLKLEYAMDSESINDMKLNSNTSTATTFSLGSEHFSSVHSILIDRTKSLSYAVAADHNPHETELTLSESIRILDDVSCSISSCFDDKYNNLASRCSELRNISRTSYDHALLSVASAALRDHHLFPATDHFFLVAGVHRDIWEVAKKFNKS